MTDRVQLALPLRRALASQFDLRKLRELLFLAGFCAYLLYTWLGATTFPLIYPTFAGVLFKILQAVCLLALGLKLLLQDYTGKQIIVLIVLGAVALASSLIGGEHIPAWSLLMVAAAKGMRLRPVAFVSLCTTFAVTVFSLYLFFLGLFPGITITRLTEVRFSLGFAHPNSLALAFLSMSVAWFLCRGARARALDLIVWVSIMMIINLVTDSRSAMVGFVILCLLVVLGKLSTRFKFGKFSRLLAQATLAFFALFAIASFVMLVSFDPENPVMFWLNQALSHRLSNAHESFMWIPPSLFGNDYSALPAVYETHFGDPVSMLVDNSYAYVLLRNGILVTIALYVGTVLVLLKAVRTNCGSVALMGLSVFVFYGLMEALLFRMAFDYCLMLMLACLIYSMSYKDLYGPSLILPRFKLYRLVTGERRIRGVNYEKAVRK